ncbi:MAG: hypothetical protein DRN12_07740 [Thermoplasmata archaeon]|nr:MAG: hypothetical protein DRN12_07740 [Thermoplasmata archaeon]
MKHMGKIIAIVVFLAILLSGCTKVPKDKKWGIYELDLKNNEVKLIYSSPFKISTLRLNNEGDTFVFSQNNGTDNKYEEIYSLNIDGSNLKRLTNNDFWDLYPTWSPNGTEIAFLSLRDKDLDIYMMDADGSNVHKFYDSGYHDADIHWAGEYIVFTSNNSIWRINDDGNNPIRITNPPRGGEWGNANLPFGDYDPQLNPMGNKIVFERLENDTSKYGNYNIFTVDIDGSNETRLTNTSYTQGFPTWSHSGEKIAYLVTAIDERGTYDIYIMNADGSENHCVTPSYFPDTFLCHAPVFSKDDSKLYFIGEWWK